MPEAAALTRGELDLASATAADIDRILSVEEPTHVINCAAYTAVDRAELEEETATRVNGEAVGHLASFCARSAIPLVTFSTDYVFSGHAEVPYVESDPVDPVNAYGRSKLIGERQALEYPDTSLVIRTSWVISGTHPNFVATMLRLGGAGRSLSVVNDQRGCPTVVDDLVAGTLGLLDNRATGIVHMTNMGETTWYDLARHAFELAGLKVDLAPCSTSDYPTPAVRPVYSVLGSERLADLGVAPLPDWRQSLGPVVEQLIDHPPA
jgi:dTDP-4-dehydrorhamnose reductase